MDEARRRAVMASNLRWRRNFAILAVVVPAVLVALVHRQAQRLRALSDHGREAQATVTEIVDDGSSRYTEYRYQVEGVTYAQTAKPDEAPGVVGAPLAITFLPEEPSFSETGFPFSAARAEQRTNPPLTRGLPLGLFLFFAGAAWLCHRAIRRSGADVAPARALSPALVGRVLGALMLAAVVATQLDAGVRAVDVKVLGERPLGVPASLVASALILGLFAPMLWLMPHLLRFAMTSNARGTGVMASGILSALARPPAELRRSRTIVLALSIYFVALMAGWIGFAAHAGI